MVWITDPEKGKKKHRVVVCTGVTEQAGQEKVQYPFSDGDKPVKHCYLCKREEGQTAITIDCDNHHDPFLRPDIRLFAVERQFKRSTAVFFLCFECALLVNPEWSNKVKDSGE